jgi:hypothetical protein
VFASCFRRKCAPGQEIESPCATRTCLVTHAAAAAVAVTCSSETRHPSHVFVVSAPRQCELLTKSNQYCMRSQPAFRTPQTRAVSPAQVNVCVCSCAPKCATNHDGGPPNACRHAHMAVSLNSHMASARR